MTLAGEQTSVMATFRLSDDSENWLSPRAVLVQKVAEQHAQHAKDNFIVVLSLRIWLDEIARELVEYFNKDFPKPELVNNVCFWETGPTYPSPNLTVTVTCRFGQNVRFGVG